MTCCEHPNRFVGYCECPEHERDEIHPLGTRRSVSTTCELCWATFPDDDELAKHVEMEEAVDWPIGGLTPDDDDEDDE